MTILVCLKCVSPYSLTNNTLLTAGDPNFSTIVTNSTFSCVLTCPSSTFKSLDSTCLSCPTGCLNCYYSDCSTCKSGFFLYKTSCVSTCPSGYITNSTSGICLQNPCLYTNSNRGCESCISPYLIQDGICVAFCADRYYREQAYCVKCD